MNKKLAEKELVNSLASHWHCYHKKCTGGQAFEQIRECIHIAFTGSDEEDVIKETIAEQKPIVTREWIEALVVDWMGLLRPDVMYDMLKNRLKEIGVEVEDEQE